MNRRNRFWICLCLPLILLASCSTNSSSSAEFISSSNSANLSEEMISITVNDTYLPLTWEENDSVLALEEKLSNGPITINTSRYGGFEQVGSLGFSLPSSDRRITTVPGDIMLYNDDNIVLFFGSNTWSYTPLAHINLSAEELSTLLNVEACTLVLDLVH